MSYHSQPSESAAGEGERRPALNLLRGKPAPPQLSKDLLGLLALPERIQGLFGDALALNLGDVVDDQVATRMKRFCREHDVEPSQLGPPVRACRAMFRLAARNNVSAEAFLSDLRALLPDEAFAPLQDIIMPIYDTVYPPLRREQVLRSIGEHGNLLKDVKWRVEVLKASQRCHDINMLVTNLTLSYKTGEQIEQLTVQLVPEQVVALRDMCNSILNE